MMTTTVKDPVCGMMIDPKTAFTTSEHEGKTFYFCSQDCADKFDADPHKYGHAEELEATLSVNKRSVLSPSLVNAM